MNNQQTENPESQIAAIKKPLLPKGCLILLFGVLIACMLPLLINTVIVFFHQVNWNFAGIDSYSIELGFYGPGGQPIQTNVVGKGKIVSSTIDGPIQPIDGPSFLRLTVNDLFSRAYGCIIYTFCRVKFDDKYGYPINIGGGFLEPSYIIAQNLEPIQIEG